MIPDYCPHLSEESKEREPWRLLCEACARRFAISRGWLAGSADEETEGERSLRTWIEGMKGRDGLQR